MQKEQGTCYVIGTPLIEDFKAVIRMNTVRGNPVTTQDIKLAEKIFGPNVGSPKRKSTRPKLPHWDSQSLSSEPTECYTLHQRNDSEWPYFFDNKIKKPVLSNSTVCATRDHTSLENGVKHLLFNGNNNNKWYDDFKCYPNVKIIVDSGLVAFTQTMLIKSVWHQNELCQPTWTCPRGGKE